MEAWMSRKMVPQLRPRLCLRMGLIEFTAEEMTSRDYYFDSYAHFGIHEGNVEDETVLDIGCGTGILPCLLPRLERPSYCCGVLQHCGLCSQIVEATELMTSSRLSRERKVDIIISEWMGYLPVLREHVGHCAYARDKWLQPDGMLFPDRCTLFICGIEDRQYKDEKINWWDDVYGFDMSSIRKVAISEPLVDVVDAKQGSVTKYLT
ncbi:hypothetical protein MSG28_000211 [Choristoneura fumiferana]|uniref:Uncharacterized protein n=1 Tax=Choristoneura fumiferana TaxID=7141 RepID=A0ACC0JZS2_CHOFU|nr:hypothetical protein MSG28_000211 [Choristoneura fumiferana]